MPAAPVPEPVPEDVRRLVAAALPQVAFDGWSARVLAGAAAETGLDLTRLRALLPGGAVDLAAASHRLGDEAMRARLAAVDLAAMRLNVRVAFALRARIEALPGREATRRAMALFTLPQNAGRGAALVWATADAIWNAVGDNATDGNWYTKRAILSAVWMSTVTFWLGDNTPGFEATHAFINRRIADVLRFEKNKARIAPLKRLLAAIPAPLPRRDLPGLWVPEDAGNG
ncbi:MAG: COQ9 family protein [Rubellimicrobium sp.]|nr:COQ9 family protein [Rubellimicrobium sp.]